MAGVKVVTMAGCLQILLPLGFDLLPGGRQADALSDLPGCALLRALILAKVGLWWAGF